MALTSIRVLVNGVWTDMSLNAATGLYEATVTAPSAPDKETPVTVEAVNDGGYRAEKTVTVNVRQEAVPPVVVITAPAEGGYYADPRRPVSFTLRDEAGGSGVDLSTLRIVIDGAALTAASPGVEAVEAENGYDVTYTPQEDLPNGPHSVSVTVSDVSGNASAPASVSWHIDTQGPSLEVLFPPVGYASQDPALTLEGTVGDAHSGLASLTINGTAVPVTDGVWSFSTSLSAAETVFTITATDAVGNQTTITRSAILDREAPRFASVDIAPDLAALGERFIITAVLEESIVLPKSPETVTGNINGQPVTFTEGPPLTFTASVGLALWYEAYLTASDAAGNRTETSAYFADGMGSKLDWEASDFLNYWDLNRIERNTDFIFRWIIAMGYYARVAGSRQNWAMEDYEDRPEFDRLRANVDALRPAFEAVATREWREILYNNTIDSGQLNAIEWDLNLLYRWLEALTKQFKVYSGQIYSGMWP